MVFPCVFSFKKGINMFGFETEHRNFMCSWKNDIEWNIAKVKELGFDTIRLPFCLQYIIENDWTNMDIVFETAKKYDMDIVLDFHRLHNTHQSPKPYDDTYSFDDFKNGWITILERYNDYDNLITVDIFNEYQGLDYNELNALYSDTIQHIENKFPNRFTYYVGGTEWGNRLGGVKVNGIDKNRIEYTIHKYYFNSGENWEENWQWSFDLANHQNLNVGEWGFISESQNERNWADRFVTWLKRKGIKSTFFWCWSPNSGDTKGILEDDCESVNIVKMFLLNKLWN
jgi:endoglucanase